MEKLKKIFCVLFGHSRIQTQCFGFWYCARCGEQIGDTIAGAYDGRGKVLVGHNCDHCHDNYKGLTWRDKLLAPYPFTRRADET